MKLNEIKEVGFYTTDLKNREVIYEVLENTDEVWLKDEPDKTLLIDEWTYTGTDTNDRKVYQCLNGNLIGVKFADDIDVVKITDVNYTTPYGNSGTIIREDKPTYAINLWEKTITKINYDVGDECVFEITKGNKKWIISLDDFFDKVIQICGEQKDD